MANLTARQYFSCLLTATSWVFIRNLDVMQKEACCYRQGKVRIGII